MVLEKIVSFENRQNEINSIIKERLIDNMKAMRAEFRQPVLFVSEDLIKGVLTKFTVNNIHLLIKKTR